MRFLFIGEDGKLIVLQVLYRPRNLVDMHK